MVLRSLHECMHAARFCSGFFFFCQPKLLLGLLCYEDDSFTIQLRFNQGSAVSRRICQKWKVDKRDSCGTRGIGLLFERHFALRMLNITIGVVTGSVLSLQACQVECGNARLQLCLLAQGLCFQSVLSFQVSVAMLYYSIISIVMVSIGSSSGS